MLIASKVAKVEDRGLFSDEEMKIIRASAFISCVKPNEVCLSASAVARIFHHSPTTIRRWCVDNKIHSYRTPNGGWVEIPLSSVVDLKLTDGDVNEYINLDIKKVDF